MLALLLINTSYSITFAKYNPSLQVTDSETGGNTSGGGNPIESDFMDKANRIADYLEKVKGQLSFDAQSSIEEFIDLVRSTSLSENQNSASIKVKCTPKDRELEQSRRNEAFTFFYDKNLIEIQCSEYQNNTSDKFKATWMILHEFGRALGLEDNTYSWSKLIIAELERISGIKRFTPLQDLYCLVEGTESDDSVRICNASADPITVTRSSLFSIYKEGNYEFHSRVRNEVSRMVSLGLCSHSAVTWDAPKQACDHLQTLRSLKK